jgi:hypothetical protein
MFFIVGVIIVFMLVLVPMNSSTSFGNDDDGKVNMKITYERRLIWEEVNVGTLHIEREGMKILRDGISRMQLLRKKPTENIEERVDLIGTYSSKHQNSTPYYGKVYEQSYELFRYRSVSTSEYLDNQCFFVWTTLHKNREVSWIEDMYASGSLIYLPKRSSKNNVIYLK